MDRFYGPIDTDAGIGAILSNFSSEYIDHVIEDSLNMRFRPFDTPMPNMVDVLKRQFDLIKANSPDYLEKVSDVESETYKEIVLKICRFYNLQFYADIDNMDDNELYGVAHVLYDVFISRFTDYMMDFFVTYIVNNADSIARSIKADDSSIKPKEQGLYSPKNYVDPKFILIHANINQIIYDMAGYDIEFETLISYFLDANVAQRILSLIQDVGDIYKTYYASFITDQRYSASTLTCIKLKLQSKTNEAVRLLG